MKDADAWKLIARVRAIEILLTEELVRWCRSQPDPAAFVKTHGETLQKRAEGMTFDGIADPARADAFAQEVQERIEAIWEHVRREVHRKAKSRNQ